MKNLLYIVTMTLLVSVTFISCQETKDREGILIAKKEKNSWAMKVSNKQLINAIKKERNLKSLEQTSIGIIEIGKVQFLEIKGVIDGSSYHEVLKVAIVDNTAYLERLAGNKVAGQSCTGDPCSKCKIITYTSVGGCECLDDKPNTRCNHKTWTNVSSSFWNEFNLVSF